MEAYRKSLSRQAGNLMQKMRWAATFFDSPSVTSSKPTYGFASENNPKPHPALTAFETDVYHLCGSVEITTQRSPFQKKLSEDIKAIRDSPMAFIAADKTTNVYKMRPDNYDKLLTENVTAKYKAAPTGIKRKIDLEAKSIAKSLNLQDRVECLAERPAFITLKDHKENFNTAPKCRLLNPAKSEIGIISKHHLQQINNEIRTQIAVNQWRNTASVIEWFKKIENKDNTRFIQLDIVDFYPSISEKLLNEALTFGKSITNIDEETLRIIQHCRKSILFTNDKVWIKKESDIFDVTMGSFDGAEVCELVGLYLLNQLKIKFPQIDFGIYRDDGLGSHTALPGPTRDRIRKQIIEVFKQNGLDITISMNHTKVDFLDVTLDLSKSAFYPFKKPNNELQYINSQSNHPPNIIKQLPKMIEKRLSELSCNESEFNRAKPDYEAALKTAGFNTKLQFTKKQNTRRTRTRRIIWFNPPYNAAVTTNIGKKFLALIDKHFPPHSKYSKIFNRNTVKISYSCTPSVKAIIASHNKGLCNPEPTATQPCNCRSQICPMDGECRNNAIIYKATVTTNDENETKEYIGSTETEFKLRYANHKTSFNNPLRKNATALSQYLWKLKTEDKPVNVKWEILHKSRPYKAGTRKCDLCISEKAAILKSNPAITLNKRNEICNKCRHRSKFKVGNIR